MAYRNDKGLRERSLGGPDVECLGLLDVLLHSHPGGWHRLVRGTRFQRPRPSLRSMLILWDLLLMS